MQPGSMERIEFYRKRAEAEQPLFEDAPEGIPILPIPKRQFNPPKEKPMNIDQAIDVLTSDGAEARLNDRISKLEDELAKLKSLRRLYGSPAARTCDIKFNVEYESKIIKAVSGGPLTPKAIEGLTGISYGIVGKIVSHSDKLTKRGDCVMLA
jgi:hypothetical protein